MKRILIAAAALLFAATPVCAKTDDDPGYKIMHDYVLSLPKVKAYEAAFEALIAASNADPSLKADVAAASSEADPTVADTIAKMTKHPRVYAFFQQQGLSKTEASLLPLILMNACMGVQYPAILAKMGNMVAPGQVDFCKANGPALKSMKFFSGH